MNEAKKYKNPFAKKVLARKPYSSHPGDKHLEIVLCETETGGPQPFVTWVRNNEDGGDFWGHYFENMADALKDFNERGKV